LCLLTQSPLEVARLRLARVGSGSLGWDGNVTVVSADSESSRGGKIGVGKGWVWLFGLGLERDSHILVC
jgi:hypothetical protein